jgi:hypothetical protein
MSHLESEKIPLCQTESRFSEWCFNQTATELYHVYKQVTLFADNAVAYINNDDCTKAVLTKEAYYYDVNCPSYVCDELTGNSCAAFNPATNSFIV